jgi:hypothetical protein
MSAVFAALARAMPPEGLTLREILAQLGERGLLLLCVLVTVPFLLPVSVPGSSVPVGVIIALNGISLLSHRTPWLPDASCTAVWPLIHYAPYWHVGYGCSAVWSRSSTHASCL